MSLLDHPIARSLLADAEVSPAAVAGCRRRLASFLQRYLPRFYRVEQHALAEVVLQGKLSKLERKTAEPIAYPSWPTPKCSKWTVRKPSQRSDPASPRSVPRSNTSRSTSYATRSPTVLSILAGTQPSPRVSSGKA